MERFLNPFHELETLRRGIDQVFAGVWPGYGGGRARFLPGLSARGYPLVNLRADDERFVVEALAPGLDTDSLDVSVQGNTLTISGEKKPIPDVPAEAFHRNERSVGRFVRTYRLDCGIDPAGVTADYRNGILTITLPKSEAARPRKVSVTAS